MFHINKTDNLPALLYRLAVRFISRSGAGLLPVSPRYTKLNNKLYQKFLV